MRILVIANSESYHTSRFANEFVKRGHEVLLLSATYYMGRVVKYDNVKHINFLNFITKTFVHIFKSKIKNFNPGSSKPYHPFNFLILFRMIYLFFFINIILKKEKFDAVFSLNLTTNGVFASRIKRYSIKICQILGCDVRLAKWYKVSILTNNKYVYKYIYRKLNYIVSGLEEQFVEFFDNKYLFPDNNKLIYMNGLGVDIEKFSFVYKSNEKKMQLYGLNDKSILAVCFRQPRPTLDFAGILHAISFIIKECPNFYFAIGTGGLEFPELQKIVKYLNIEKNILFLGNINYEELHLYIAQGDIYLDPINIKKFPETKSSGISGSLLESMSCGLIPIVGKRPGLEVYFSETIMQEYVYNDMETNLANYLKKAILKINDAEIKQSFRRIVQDNSNWNYNIDNILNHLQSDIHDRKN